MSDGLIWLASMPMAGLGGNKLEPVGIADGDHKLAHSQALRVPKGRWHEVGGVDSQHREIGPRIIPDPVSLEALAIGKAGAVAGRAVDHVKDTGCEFVLAVRVPVTRGATNLRRDCFFQLLVGRSSDSLEAPMPWQTRLLLPKPTLTCRMRTRSSTESRG